MIFLLNPGRSKQVTTAVRVIAPDDYDAALRLAPHDCPLLCVAGDRRSGAALLADLAADRRHSAEVLAQGQGAFEWTAQLERLAAELEPRLARVTRPLL